MARYSAVASLPERVVNRLHKVLVQTDAGTGLVSLEDAVTAVGAVSSIIDDTSTFTALGGTQSREINGKLGEALSILDFIPKSLHSAIRAGTDATDCGPYFQNAFNTLNTAGGGILKVPAGRYRKGKGSAGLLMYSNTSMVGDGASSIIFHDDTTATGRVDLLTIDNANNVSLEDFQVVGTLATYPNETNQSQCLRGSNITNLVIRNVTIRNVRYMATSFSYVTNAIVEGCTFDTVQRDGCRFTNSWNVVIDGNVFRNVSDDAVALHSLDAATVPGSGYVISDNVFEGSQGIDILGAKAASITGNVFRRAIRSPINIVTPTGTEGSTPLLAIRIEGNTLLDCFGSFGTNYVIRVKSLARATGGLGTQPGATSSIFPYANLNNLDAGGVANIGGVGISVCNNIIGRTLDATAGYENYGFGKLVDRATVGVFANPAITDASFNVHAIQIEGPSAAVSVKNNVIFGLGAGYNAITLTAAGTANFLDFAATLIEGNIIYDCPGVGLSCNFTGSSARDVMVRNNWFDMDPLFRAASHNSDNTWSSSAFVIAINCGSTIPQLILAGNTFKNCGAMDSGTDSGPILRDVNYAYAQVVSASDSASNLGIRQCSANRNIVYIDYDADPTSGTFGKVLNFPKMIATSIPTTGRYVIGHYTRNSAPSISTGKVLLGWSRLTTGTSHTAGTDWTPVYGTTS